MGFHPASELNYIAISHLPNSHMLQSQVNVVDARLLHRYLPIQMYRIIAW